jgi:hypothetical protein
MGPAAADRGAAGFPSLAADDLEEPIDLGNWLIAHLAASCSDAK